MNYGSYESTQCVELNDNITEVLFTFDCSNPGTPAQTFGPAEACYEAEAAEFELDSVHVLDGEGNPVTISMDILMVFVGTEMAQKMMEYAETEAIESGEFD